MKVLYMRKQPLFYMIIAELQISLTHIHNFLTVVLLIVEC